MDRTNESVAQPWRGKLIPHPTSGDCSVHSIQATAMRRGDAALLHYEVAGDIAKLAMPLPGEARRVDGLWEHTCFEAFLGDGDAYYELNFSPSGEWALYRFERYRTALSSPTCAAPSIKIASTESRFDLYAEFLLDDLPLNHPLSRPLGLSAVIEEKNGDIAYWALAHGEGAPDFHNASCFIGQIP